MWHGLGKVFVDAIGNNKRTMAVWIKCDLEAMTGAGDASVR